MSERNEITRVICEVTDAWDEPLDEVHDVPPVVNAVLAWLAERDAALAARPVVDVEAHAEWGVEWFRGADVVPLGEEAQARRYASTDPDLALVMRREVTDWLVTPPCPNRPRERSMSKTDLPFTVVDEDGISPGSQIPVIGRFATLAEAEAYCDTLIDAETGRYGIDGP